MDEEKAIEAIESIHSLFVRNHIKYWVDQGTLLGVVRSKKLISWDTDIDIQYLYQKDNLLFIRSIIYSWIVKEGYKVITDCNESLSFKKDDIVISVSGLLQKEWMRLISIVCFYIPTIIRKGILHALHELYSKNPSNKIRPFHELERTNTISRFAKIFYITFFCGKTVEQKIYDTNVMILINAEEILFMTYGTDWRTPMKKGTYNRYTADWRILKDK